MLEGDTLGDDGDRGSINGGIQVMALAFGSHFGAGVAARDVNLN
jgi:hypothetical protein